MVELGDIALGLILGSKVDWFALMVEQENLMIVVVPDLLKIMET